MSTSEHPLQLPDWGWAPYFEQNFAAVRESGWIPARVIREDRERYLVWGEPGELAAAVSGRLRHAARGRADFPAVGDWVAVELRPNESAATIHALVPRLTRFSRRAAGAQFDEQILAANIDTAFLVCGLDGDFNPRRIERYLEAADNSGAMPVVVLNKADCCADTPARAAEIQRIAAGVAVHPVSARDGTGVDALRMYLSPGQTVVLLGSSGVGKSTLINALLGCEQQAANAVREDDSHGRHTTTRRELFVLPAGGVVIDVPGLRELQLWDSGDGGGAAFADIEALAAQCRFRDCTHQGEPDCAVLAALTAGALDAGHLENYRKLQREARHLAGEQDRHAREVEKARWKTISKLQKRLKDERGRWRL